MKTTKRLLATLLALLLALALLAPGASATDGVYPEGDKPWWIMPWALKIQYAVKSLPQMGRAEDSLLIMHDGKLVYEEYAEGHGPETPHIAMSVTKSVVATLVGICVGDGLIDVQDKVSEYYPEADFSDTLDYPSKLNMTVEHLLQMRSGLPDTQDCFKAGDAGLAAFLTPQESAPGAKFKYNSGAGPQCLVGIVERATGMGLLDFAQERLFGPLGITGVAWDATDCGSPKGGFGISITSPDMLRLGQLYLNGGLWNDTRILPEGWTDSVRPQGFNTIVSYGYLFWGNGWWGPFMGGSYEARGFYGQFITIYPKRGVVVVRTGSGGNR